MFVRFVDTGSDADRELCAAFACQRDDEPWAAEIERDIQTKAFKRAAANRTWRLLMLFEGDVDNPGECVALAAHEPLEPGKRRGEGRFLVFVAVRSDQRGHRHGQSLFEAMLYDASLLCPGGRAIWKVDVRNGASQAIVAPYASRGPTPHESSLLIYEADLPDATD